MSLTGGGIIIMKALAIILFVVGWISIFVCMTKKARNREGK